MLFRSKLAKSTLAGALFFAPAQMISFAALAQSSPVVLTFSTVGDSRQDPVTYDKASVGETLSGQDAKWLQSTKAFSRILASIQAQKSKILFFNGDMIHGYGIAGIGYTSNLDQSQINGTKGNNVAPIGPVSTADIIKSDLLKFYQQYAFWRGMIAPMMEAFTRDVEVTRRLYRSGESEYLIDGEVCRLRDIHDLLMDSGLGVKAYAVIEQGKIGQILSSRPAERRALIEEAAGVTKYKSRRRQAELKLDAAHQNLTRIEIGRAHV